MQDRLGDLRDVVAQVNPGAVSLIRGGGLSAVLDTAVAGGDVFDLERHLGIRDGRPGEPAQSPFMGEFLDRLEGLKAGIARVHQSMEEIRALKRRVAYATTSEAEKEISDELAAVLDTTNREVLTIKRGLDQVKEDNAAFASKNPNSSEARMRENLAAAVTRKFKEILKEYQTVQTDYKKEVREKVTRQVKIVYPEVSDEEVSQMVEQGDSATAQAIRMRISGQTHESLQNALSDIQDKYRDIRRLEQSVVELHQMFVDLSTLVDAQGELLDQIEFSVNEAKDYTVGLLTPLCRGSISIAIPVFRTSERAEKELIITRKNQKSAKRRMCWLSVCIVVVAVVVLIPVISTLTR